MKLNEYINKLTEILNEHGNLEVKNNRFPQCDITVEVGYMYKATDKRIRGLRIWSKYSDKEENKGEKVVPV